MCFRVRLKFNVPLPQGLFVVSAGSTERPSIIVKMF